MAILCVHKQEPNWPADPNRPIYWIDGYWVETNGPAPTSAEVEAVVNPPPLTAEQIKKATYVQDMALQKVLKAFVIALNKGTFVPGSNYTNAQMEAIVKAEM